MIGKRTIGLTLLIVSASAFVLGMNAPAHAAKPQPIQADREDITVTLNDGAFYKGVLLELVPKDHVTIRLSTGEIKRFAWTKVKKTEPVEQPQTPSSPEKLGGSPNAPSDDTTDGARTDRKPDASVLLRVNSDDPQTTVQQLLDQSSTVAVAANLSGGVAIGGSQSESWRQVCVAPCGVPVSPNLKYRVEGPSFKSSPFVLPQGVDQVQLKVKSGSRGGQVFGGILLGLGIGSIVGFAWMLALDSTRVAGGITMAAGGVVTLIGIPVVLATRTTVHASTGQRLALHLGPLVLGPYGFQF